MSCGCRVLARLLAGVARGAYGRGRWSGRLSALAILFVAHLLVAAFARGIGDRALGSVGIDTAFREVVRAAAGWWCGQWLVHAGL